MDKGIAFNVSEVAALYGIKSSKVYYMIQRGCFPNVFYGKNKRPCIPLEDCVNLKMHESSYSEERLKLLIDLHKLQKSNYMKQIASMRKDRRKNIERAIPNAKENK